MSGRYRRSGYRRSYNTGRLGYKRSRNFGRSSALVKRARGNMKAANNQTDSADVTINLIHSCYSGVGAAVDDRTITSTRGKVVPMGVQAVNIYEMLRRSSFYKSYANMYDQFRVTSVKVKITPTQWSTFDQAYSTVNNPDNVKQTRSLANTTTPTIVKYIYNPVWQTEDPNNVAMAEDENDVEVIWINKPPANAQYTAEKPLYLAVYNDGTVVEGGSNHYETQSGGTATTQATLANAQGIYPEEINTSTNYAKLIYKVKAPSSTTYTQTDEPVFTGQLNPNEPDSIYNGSYAGYINPQSITIVTAWDRSGLDNNQVLDISGWTVTRPDVRSWVKLDEFPFDNNGAYIVTIGDDITSYSSAQTKQLISGSVFNCIRYLYPSSQQENSVFYSTSNLVPVYDDKYFNYFIKPYIEAPNDSTKLL
ncbi:hypothetical protein PIROE2DRAFT_18066 [Piromyces sp. E2]|nr:hypothetical protein PIROE2DRAFT_18066 [Piromyces sp. E2]|eukprot:OUM57054.1 hypothetical protein PIROE2DRAFT_18066 [Piromyces sp. E2]